MAAAHHAAQDSRYSLPPPPPNPYNNRRLPSLKDLNFSYRLPPLAQDSPSSGHVSVAVDPSAQLQDHSVRQDHAIRQEHAMRPEQPMRQDHSVRQDHQVRQDIRQDPSLRHVEQWRRANTHTSISPASTNHPEPQQQHTPPLSAGHEQPVHKIMDYSHPSSRHDHGGYVTPGMPLSGQMTQAPAPMPSSSGTVRGGDDLSHLHSHHKRARTSSSSSVDVPRDARPPPPMSYSPAHYAHTPYMHPSQSHQAHQGHQAHQQPPPPPHPSHQQHPASPYHPMPSGPPVHPSPSPHTHNMHHHSPVQPHPGYASYQQSYMPPSQPRPPEVHPQHPHHMNPAYQSPVHPPPPPPQDHWEQQHSQPHAHHHPPTPSHPMHQHHNQQPIPAPAPVPAPAPAPAPAAVPAPAPAPPVQQHPHQHIHQQPQPQTMHVPAPPPPVQQPQPQPSFTRTTALIPTDVDTRTASYPPNGASARDSLVNEIIKHCSILYSFASRYAQMQASIPHSQPSPAELADMQHRANYVVRLLEDLRRQMQPDSERVRTDSPVTVRSPDDHRQPKRPWEDMSHDGAAGETEGPYPEEYASPDPPPKAPSAAELDMELIRSKRATSTAGGGGSIGQTKNKYRKRSRATPPGKCHSCNIRETPEWRRGPDGARTLCNACGLHYAKLMRKQDKQHNGAEPPRIDMDTLRASARAAEQDKSHSRSAKHQARRKTEPESPIERPSTSQQAQHHQSSFQLVPVAPAQEQSPISDASRLSSQPSIHPPPPPQTSMAAPPPPWATNNRSYSSEQMQPQSFVRTAHSHPPTR